MTLSFPHADPGTVVRDSLVLIDRLPTGQPETLPVIVANGHEDGPTLWVTGSIHGDEVTATAVCQDIVSDGLVDHLAGRLVILPTLNPAGLRRTTRTSYYDGEDPNRKFPDVEYVKRGATPAETIDGPRPPTQQQLLCRRLFDCFSADADALLDIHTATVGSAPFVIQDRVLYDRGLRDREAALSLADAVTELADAFGLPVVFEYPPEEYLDENLHLSTSGSALNQAGIPALTVELGSHSVVDDELRRQGVAGIYRAMEHMEMVGDATEAFPKFLGPLPDPVPAPRSGQHRRFVGPHVQPGATGIVRHDVDAGDVVEPGQTIARVVDPTGNPDSARELSSEHNGWVLGRLPGIAGYEHTATAWLAVEDDSDPIGAPEDE